MAVKGQTDITHTIAHPDPWCLWSGVIWQLQVGFAQGGLCGLMHLRYNLLIKVLTGNLFMLH